MNERKSGMMSPVGLVLAGLLFSTLPALAAKSDLRLVLQWRPTELEELAKLNPTGLDRTRIALTPFLDGRADRELVGENREEEDEGKARRVRTQSDVAEFCRARMAGLLKDAGLQVVASEAEVSLSAEVVQFMVVERNTYVGTVRLRVEAKGRDGASLWNGYAIGTSTRWGRSFKADNYNETLSDALLVATVNLMNDEGLRQVLGQAR